MSISGDINILYIAGVGRSGSTLLDRCLGQVPGFVSLGEMAYVWERCFKENQLCGCGVPFQACEFWHSVVAEAYGEKFDSLVHEASYLWDAIIQNKSALVLPSGLKSSRSQNQIESFGRILKKLYAAVQAQTECKWIIDSSNLPSFGYVLAGIPGVNVHVLHLVRDSRASAFSWQKRKIKLDRVNPEYLVTYSPAKSSRMFLSGNIWAQQLGRRVGGYTCMRYEDFAADPENGLHNILCELKFDHQELAFMDGATANLAGSHMVGGNPMRMKEGEVFIRPDMDWKRHMKPWSKFVVTAATWPLLLKYGYSVFKAN